MHEESGVSRRTFVRTAAGIWILASGGHLFAADCPPTPRNVAGPYWREGAPFRTRLWTDEPGEILSIRGTISDADCRPLADAIVDLWQADANGRYDSELQGFDAKAYRLRGRVKSDSRGQYTFQTIRPAAYGMGGNMRPAHIHAIVTTPGRRSLVTQMYFHGDPHLQDDPIRQVRDSLVMQLAPAPLAADIPRGRRHYAAVFNIVFPS